MRLALVTSCRNPGVLLHETVASVFAQRVVSDDAVLVDYAIVDANSEDGTAEYLASLTPPPWLRLTILREPDRGLYDGLWKGFGLVEGDWFGWVNAGDLLAPGCHRTLAAVDTVPDVRWVTGLQVHYGRNTDIIRAALPLRYRGDLLRRGLYGRTLLPFVQQESTFWRADLQRTIPPEFADMRLAGDLWLWSHFAGQLGAERHPLAVVAAHLGGFRSHDGHLSATAGSRAAYLADADRLVGPVRRLDRVRGHVEARRWRTVKGLRKRPRQRTLLVEDGDVHLHLGRPLPDRMVTALRRTRLGRLLGSLRRAVRRLTVRSRGDDGQDRRPA